MLNRYPLWKYLMLVAITVIAFIYSIPNIYVPDPAVQVSTESSGAVVVESDLKKIESALTKAEIEFFGSELSGKTAIVRVKDRDHQMLARKVIQKSLGDGYVVAMKNAQTTPQWLQSLGGAPMKLGLDLAGGVHFLLEVDTPSAITKRQEINADEMKEKLRKEKIRYLTLSHNTNNEIIGRFKSAEVRDNAISELRSEYPQLSFLAPEEKEGTTEFNFIATFTEAAIIDIEDYAIEQNLVALRNRVNELGVSEPIVQRQGRNRIIVQLPGVQDPAEAKRVIGKTANLEFRLSADSNTPVLNQEQFKRKNDREQAIEGNAILERQIIVTGDRVTDAQVTLNEDNLPAVSIKLDGQGGDKMYLVTRKNIKRPMGILFIEYKNRTEIVKNARGEEVEKNTQYVEKTVISEATIQSALGTNFQITGLGDAEAAELALLLRAGALAAPMHFVEERVIGPSLGAENIKTGVQATILGLLVVVVFMVIFYRLFGLFANIALALNVLLIMTILSWFGATLTLPGIAGIVLTIGMAVDANVLIFSRIREEMSRGASPQQAIFAGYERAFITIFDSNLTTFLVALILFIIGTGPVKGFAITLCVGIATSMFTAIVASRALVNLYYGNRKNLQKNFYWELGNMTQEKIIDFMGVRRITSGISIFLVLASIVCLSTLGLKGGLDFTGGTQLEILADKGVSIPQVRAVLEEEKLKSPTAVLFGSDLEVMIRTQDQMKLKAQELLNKALAENGQISAVRRPDMAQEGYAEVLVVTNSNLEKIKASGVFNPEQFGRVEIKQENTDILVAIEKSLDSVYVNYLIRKIETATGTNIELRSSEFVGPQIGDELRDQGGLGLLAAFFAVFLYVAVQFQWKFSGGAIIALVHDVTITLGFFSFFQWDFDLTVLAAILALIGYSINDTIVIYDRIRENFRVLRKMDPLQVINISITQTLGRSIMTSMTVFLVLVVLFLFGGEVLHGFSKALLIGVVVGTYSSIYIAANITVAFGVTKEDLMPKVHDNSEADQLP